MLDNIELNHDVEEETTNDEETPIVDEIPPLADAEEPKRYYYKAKAGNGFLNFKSPLSAEELENYEEITKEEFEQLTHVEPTLVYEPTEEELAIRKKKARIALLKGKLAKTDYIIIKIAEAVTQEEKDAIRAEYDETIANRIAWRKEINQIESELKGELE